MKENIDKLNPRHFILVGDEGTWKTALEHYQWGFSERNVGLWNTTNDDDLISFYVTKPIQKIIGFGAITDKFISNEILWPDEKFFKKSLWKYRVKFQVKYLIKNWENGLSVPTNIMLNIGRKVIEKDVYDKFLSEAESKWKIASNNTCNL